MKKYNLKKTWEYCLAMWKYVAEEWQKDHRDIDQLKREWVAKYSFGEMQSNCFFCHYETSHPRKKKFNSKNECPKCPGVEVAPLFSCYNSGWDTDPVKFYRILKRMYGRKKKLAGWK